MMGCRGSHRIAPWPTRLQGRFLLGAALAVLAGPLSAGTAIVGATVHTLEDATPIEGATVLVDDGRIEAVGADLTVPPGYERVDAAGKVVTPGLIESYSQIGLVEIGGEPSTVDALVSHVVIGDEVGVERLNLGPAFDVQYALNADSMLIPVNRMAGVTRAVVAPLVGNDPLAGWGAAIRLAGAADQELLTRPRLAMFGEIDADVAVLVGGSRAAVIQRLRMAFEQAGNHRPGRYQIEPGGYTSAELAALRELLEGEAPLVLTVHRAAEIRQALALAADFDLELVIHGGSEAWKVAADLARARVPVIIDVLDNLPLNYDRLGARLDNAALLAEAGVPLMFTAEESHNAGLLRQAAGNAVAEGVPWASALAAVTRVPAETFAFPEGAGTLAAGAPADLVIWTGDPLEITQWAERVMIDGRWVPMRSRQTRLLERYRDLDRREPFGYH